MGIGERKATVQTGGWERKGKRNSTRRMEGTRKTARRITERERFGLFESGLHWQHSVSMATIKIGLHIQTQLMDTEIYTYPPACTGVL